MNYYFIVEMITVWAFFIAQFLMLLSGTPLVYIEIFIFSFIVLSVLLILIENKRNE